MGGIEAILNSEDGFPDSLPTVSLEFGSWRY